MKITDPDVIKNGEKELIDAVKDDLDLDVVKQILEKKISQTTLQAKGGEIIVHDNQIAFRLDFDLNLSGSLMFDRDGSYIPESGETFEAGDIEADNSYFDEPDPEMPLEEEEDPLGDTLLDDDLADEDLKIDFPENDDIEDIDSEDDIEKIENSDDDLLMDPLADDDDAGPEESVLGMDDPDSDDSGLDDLDRLTDDVDLEDSDENDLEEEDIDDILKESQDFWNKS